MNIPQELHSSSDENSYESDALSSESEKEDGPSTIEPYQFEPEWSADEDVDDDAQQETEFLVAEDEPRLQNLDWCKCGNCVIMDNSEECKCCQEMPAIYNKNLEAVEQKESKEVPTCITEHPGFEAVCLSRWVLQTAWYQYRQQYEEAYDGPEDKLNRHIAYRQLARWCWGILGKEIRVVLPSCAVTRIRAKFPPPGPAGEFQFEGFHHAYE